METAEKACFNDFGKNFRKSRQKPRSDDLDTIKKIMYFHTKKTTIRKMQPTSKIGDVTKIHKFFILKTPRNIREVTSSQC